MKVSTYQSEEILSLASESGDVVLYSKKSIAEEKFLGRFKAYQSRVKALSVREKFLVTVSTEGDLSIWDVEEILSIKENFGNVFENYLSLYDLKINSRLVILDSIKYLVKPKKEETEEKEVEG